MERGDYFDRDYAAVVRELYDRGVNNHNPWAVWDLLSPDVAVHRLDTGKTTDGKRAFVQEQARWLDAVPDYQVVVENVVVEGDRAVARLTCHGTPVKPCGAARPTGQSFAISALHEFRFEDGKIVEAWLLDDRMAMVRQLGLLPGSLGGLLRVAGARLRWLVLDRPRTAHGPVVEPDEGAQRVPSRPSSPDPESKTRSDQQTPPADSAVPEPERTTRSTRSTPTTAPEEPETEPESEESAARGEPATPRA